MDFMNRNPIIKIAFYAMFILLVCLLLFTFYPQPINKKTIRFIPISPTISGDLPDGLPQHLFSDYLLILSYPQHLWLGQTQYVTLKIEPEPQLNKDESKIHSLYSTSLEARLYLTSMEVLPGNDIFQTFQGGKSAQFIWEVTPLKHSDNEGKLWLFITVNHRDGFNLRIPVFALPIETKILSIVGWPLLIERGLIITGLFFIVVIWVILPTSRKKRDLG